MDEAWGAAQLTSPAFGGAPVVHQNVPADAGLGASGRVLQRGGRGELGAPQPRRRGARKRPAEDRAGAQGPGGRTGRGPNSAAAQPGTVTSCHSPPLRLRLLPKAWPGAVSPT